MRNSKAKSMRKIAKRIGELNGSPIETTYKKIPKGNKMISGKSVPMHQIVMEKCFRKDYKDIKKALVQ